MHANFGGRLETLTDEMCQVNTRVGHIARWQTYMAGLAPSPSPSPKASLDDEDDADSSDNDDLSVTGPLSFVNKRGSVGFFRVVLYLRGECI